MQYMGIAWTPLLLPPVATTILTTPLLPRASVSKQVLVKNVTYEYEPLGGTHFHMNGFP